MKPRLYDIINTFDKTSKQLNERADTDVDLRVAMTQKTQDNSISVRSRRACFRVSSLDSRRGGVW